MLFTTAARDLLRRLENCKLTAYQDGAGVWTIGVGHTGPDIREGLVWTQEQADAALDLDLKLRVETVEMLVASNFVKLTNNQFSVVVGFGFPLAGAL